MAARTILIIGGAGFIGSHLVDAHLAAGDRVRVLDCLVPQVHGERRTRPSYLSKDAELIIGDVRDPHQVRRALEGVDGVYHLAARVGVGQSMYDVKEYTDTNTVGSAVLMEALMQKPVGRLVVASSMSLYGEGLYRSANGVVEDVTREVEDLKRGIWEPHDSEGRPLAPLPTPESKRPALASVYALSKYDQERLCLMLGEAYGIPSVALRFFNVYGTRHALSNPYTGVLAIFGSRLLNGRRPRVFEDGKQRRDFVHVSDIVQACMRAMGSDARNTVFNVGSGRSSSVVEIARALAEVMERPDLAPEVTGRYRVGDIRHCFADISHACATLGYEPRVRLEDGLRELAGWLRSQVAVDHHDRALAELDSRGLTL